MRVALIIEADAETAKFSEIALGAAGFVPFWVESGEKALSLMEGRLPDVVVLGLELPGMTGAEVLGLMRAAPRTAQVPTIVVTNCPTLEASIEEEADAVLVKPVNGDQLTQKALALAH